MALADWLWLVKLIMEILKLISQLPEDELKAIAQLRTCEALTDLPQAKPDRKKKIQT